METTAVGVCIILAVFSVVANFECKAYVIGLLSRGFVDDNKKFRLKRLILLEFVLASTHMLITALSCAILVNKLAHPNELLLGIKTKTYEIATGYIFLIVYLACIFTTLKNIWEGIKIKNEFNKRPSK